MIALLTTAAALAWLAGSLHGGRDAQHADLKVFEKRWNVSPLSFFGSQSWRRKYKDADPAKKERVWYTSFSDYWHVSAWLSKLLIVSAVLIAACPDVPKAWWPAIGAGIALIDAAGKATAYKWLRYKRLV